MCTLGEIDSKRILWKCVSSNLQNPWRYGKWYIIFGSYPIHFVYWTVFNIVENQYQEVSPTLMFKILYKYAEGPLKCALEDLVLLTGGSVYKKSLLLKIF